MSSNAYVIKTLISLMSDMMCLGFMGWGGVGWGGVEWLHTGLGVF